MHTKPPKTKLATTHTPFGQRLVQTINLSVWTQGDFRLQRFINWPWDVDQMSFIQQFLIYLWFYRPEPIINLLLHEIHVTNANRKSNRFNHKSGMKGSNSSHSDAFSALYVTAYCVRLLLSVKIPAHTIYSWKYFIPVGNNTKIGTTKDGNFFFWNFDFYFLKNRKIISTLLFLKLKKKWQLERSQIFYFLGALH